MEQHPPSPPPSQCPHCGEELTPWAGDIGHCHVCMRPLETPVVESRLPTAEDYHPGLAELIASVEVDDDEDLTEDTMRYTKASTRVLLQEDTGASAHYASSASLDAAEAPAPQGQETPIDQTTETDEFVRGGYSVQEHLPTEETPLGISADHDLRSTAVLGSNTRSKNTFDIDLEDEPTLRVLASERPSTTIAEPPREIAPPDTKNAAQKKPSETQDDEPTDPARTPAEEARYKEVKALLGADKAAKYSPYMLEEQHTLSQPMDIVKELREREAAKEAPHMAASFALSRTLQDLSLKEVDEIPKPKPAPAPPPAKPPKTSFPNWVVWLVGGLLWVGVASLLLKIIYAPTPTPPPPTRQNEVRQKPKPREFSLPRFEEIDNRPKAIPRRKAATPKPETVKSKKPKKRKTRKRRKYRKRRKRSKKRKRRKRSKKRKRQKRTKKRKTPSPRRKPTRRRKPTKKRKPAER